MSSSGPPPQGGGGCPLEARGTGKLETEKVLPAAGPPEGQKSFIPLWGVGSRWFQPDGPFHILGCGLLGCQGGLPAISPPHPPQPWGKGAQAHPPGLFKVALDPPGLRGGGGEFPRKPYAATSTALAGLYLIKYCSKTPRKGMHTRK